MRGQRHYLVPLLEIKLGESLADYVEARRQPRLSWRQLARKLEQETGVSVSHETLRNLFNEREAADEASADEATGVAV